MEKIVYNGEVFDGLEDLSYSDDAPDSSPASSETSEADYDEYLEARDVGILLSLPGFHILLKWANLEAESAIKAQSEFISMSSKDDEKKEKLDTDRKLKVYCRNWLRQTVENASEVPKPVK
jgi:hypothetical protein